MKDRSRRLTSAVTTLAEKIPSPCIRLMEVCGTHTMAIFRHGLHEVLPEKIRLMSGPGCPVCVTPAGYVDAAIEMSRLPDTTIVTFGDMFRVPGSESSLENAKASGADIRVVYSPHDALRLARTRPDRRVILLAVGFETTAPVVASLVLGAAAGGSENFLVLCGHKLIPPAMEALVRDGEARIDGFLCPGHVSVVIGTAGYETVAATHHKPCVITGFEPDDILLGVFMLLSQMAQGKSEVEIEYVQCVKPEGNPAAIKQIERVFERCDSAWRGLGEIPMSGLRLRPEFSAHDAEARTGVRIGPGREPAGCICGDVLRGVAVPTDCKLFAARCRPETPVGPCMVSSEGTCAAYFKYGQLDAV